jgi:hypothetical protein
MTYEPRLVYTMTMDVRMQIASRQKYTPLHNRFPVCALRGSPPTSSPVWFSAILLFRVPPTQTLLRLLHHDYLYFDLLESMNSSIVFPWLSFASMSAVRSASNRTTDLFSRQAIRYSTVPLTSLCYRWLFAKMLGV